MTHEKYEVLQEWMGSIYDEFYDRAVYIEEVGHVSEFLKLKDWLNQEYKRVKSWSVGCNAEDKVLKEINHDFNYLLNELDDVIK